MSLQRQTSLMMLILSTVVTGSNIISSLQNDLNTERLIGLVNAGIGVLLFPFCIRFEAAWAKLAQTAYTILTAAVTMKSSAEPIMGAFILLVAFSLWYAYGWYEQHKIVMHTITAVVTMASLTIAYASVRRGAVTSFAVLLGMYIIWVCASYRARIEHRRYEASQRIADAAIQASKETIELLRIEREARSVQR